MGNQLSCTSDLSTAIAAPAIRNIDMKPHIAIVNAVDGRACQVEEPLSVGELMLEFPGHCVAEFSTQNRMDCTQIRPSHILEQGINVSGRKGRRIVALSADQNLCARHIYFLMPLQRMETRLSDAEVQVLIIAASRLARNPSSAHMNTSKITPLSQCECEEAASILVATEETLSRVGELLWGRKGGKAQQEEEKMDNGVEPGYTRTTMSRARSWTPKLDTIAEVDLGS